MNHGGDPTLPNLSYPVYHILVIPVQGIRVSYGTLFFSTKIVLKDTRG